MQELERYLTALNLNDDQIELFLTIASEGPLTILELSSKTSIPRTTVYLYVEEMLKNELLKETLIGKKKKYQAASVTRLTSIIKEKKDQYERISQDLTLHSPELEMYYYASSKPKIRVCEGDEALRKLFQEIAQEDKVYLMWSSEHRKELTELVEYLNDLLSKYMVHTKEIILSDHLGKLRKIHAQTSRNEIALLPLEYHTETDLIISANKVIHIIYSETPMAFILEDKRISYSERMKFMALWQSYSSTEE